MNHRYSTLVFGICLTIVLTYWSDIKKKKSPRAQYKIEAKMNLVSISKSEITIPEKDIPK